MRQVAFKPKRMHSPHAPPISPSSCEVPLGRPLLDERDETPSADFTSVSSAGSSSHTSDGLSSNSSCSSKVCARRLPLGLPVLELLLALSPPGLRWCEGSEVSEAFSQAGRSTRR